MGRSRYTDELGVRNEQLPNGAYRIVSGTNWLVLIGTDTHLMPIEPWPRSHQDRVSGRTLRAWDAVTGKRWGNPLWHLYKYYSGRATVFDNPGGPVEPRLKPVDVWGFDERGSFNAVCGFLRRLGVRWYMPGELGEVVPSMRSIPLPRIDETVRPDCAVRRINFRFGVHGPELSLWAMRLGLRDPYGLQIAHNMTTMTDRREFLEAHPDWFALYGGKRQNDPHVKNNRLCYCNEGLFRETVAYVRTVFDHYRFDVVSVMPPDGYVALSQCPLWKGKETPERGSRGRLSDYVWDFVNRVAREVAKTHPNKKVSCCAYGAYSLPPLKIKKLEPNVLVCIVGGRRPTNNRPGQQGEIRRLRESCLEKTDQPIMLFENYPFTDRGSYLPAFVPHTLVSSINETKGISLGEDIWLSVNTGFREDAVGFNHFLVYFTARMYWGGKQQEVEAMLDEYGRLFYGPAAQAMRAFFDYCEANWQQMEKDRSKVDRALALFDAAVRAAEPGSVYARRLALIDKYLDDLRSKRRQLAQRRGPVPKLRLVGLAHSEIRIDGRLDERAWQQCPVAATAPLRELQTGRLHVFGTTVKAAWRGSNLYFAIRCDDRSGEPPKVTTKQNDDPAIWYGHVVEILLETDSHSYYQIAVNPAGAVADLDRGATRSAWFDWTAEAEVATHVADGSWTVEIRIPVTEDPNDPLHQVVGRKPTQSLPWHINVCRQRVRENGTEHSALSPTGTASLHVPLKFAHFYDGRSHRFEADPSVTDYVIARRAAIKLMGPRRREEALAAFLALEAGKAGKPTDLQRSDALELAAACLRSMRQFDRADALAERIPIAAVAKTVRMENLLAQRKWAELVRRFGDEQIVAWPFWQCGAGWFARGRALAALRRGKEAEADLTRALQFTSEPRTRTAIWLAIGRNRQRNLKDDEGALAAYRAIIDPATHLGAADQLSAVQEAAQLLAKRKQFDEALALLKKVDIEGMQGSWRGSMPLVLGDLLHAAGQGGSSLPNGCRRPFAPGRSPPPSAGGPQGNRKRRAKRQRPPAGLIERRATVPTGCTIFCSAGLACATFQ